MPDGADLAKLDLLRRRARAIAFATAAAVLAVLMIVPSWREVFGLSMRVLLVQHGWDTYVHGAVGGCVIYPVPWVELSERRKNELALSERPEDRLAVNALGNRGDLPVERWLGNRLLPWAAANSISAGSVPSRVDDRERAKKLIAAAQKMEPANGLLWFSEAAILTAEHRDDEAEAALRISVERQPWNLHTREVADTIVEILVRAGLPRSIAMQSATSEATGLQRGFAQWDLGQVVQGLFRHAAAKNPDELEQAAKLTVRLLNVSWIDPPLEDATPTVVYQVYMALDGSPPARGERGDVWSYVARVRGLLAGIVDPETMDKLLVTPAREMHGNPLASVFETSFAFMPQLFLWGLILAAWILGIPFMFRCLAGERIMDLIGDRRLVGYSFICFIAAPWILTSAIGSCIHPPVGLQIIDPSETTIARIWRRWGEYEIHFWLAFFLTGTIYFNWVASFVERAGRTMLSAISVGMVVAVGLFAFAAHVQSAADLAADASARAAGRRISPTLRPHSAAVQRIRRTKSSSAFRYAAASWSSASAWPE